MPDSLELPNGDVVTPDDVFLYNDYPYRLVWVDSEEYAFELSPLYWGDSGMDVPFRDREALVDQWDADSEGLLPPDGWERWLDHAEGDARFTDHEVAALAAALPGTDDRDATSTDGPLARLRALLGR
jgi:hypothetical protein